MSEPEPLAVQAARSLLHERVRMAHLQTSGVKNYLGVAGIAGNLHDGIAACHAVVEAERHLRFALVDAAKAAE
jgi:hypothetical protein